jgi:hypothetical protein
MQARTVTIRRLRAGHSSNTSVLLVSRERSLDPCCLRNELAPSIFEMFGNETCRNAGRLSVTLAKKRASRQTDTYSMHPRRRKIESETDVKINRSRFARALVGTVDGENLNFAGDCQSKVRRATKAYKGVGD